jgi:hypothetical protein
MSQLETTTSIAEDVINFCFPVRELESDRVKLIPFIVSRIKSFHRDDIHNLLK